MISRSKPKLSLGAHKKAQITNICFQSSPNVGLQKHSKERCQNCSKRARLCSTGLDRVRGSRGVIEAGAAVVVSGGGNLDWMFLKYKAIADAKRELGAISEIRDTFIGFQEYLYTNKDQV